MPKKIIGQGVVAENEIMPMCCEVADEVDFRVIGNDISEIACTINDCDMTIDDMDCQTCDHPTLEDL